MRSDRLTFVYDNPDNQSAGRSAGYCVDKLVSLVKVVAATCSALVMIALLTGCSNAQVRRTPVTDLGEAWFCEMNEARDDWECVQNDELARNPQPTRLPSDPAEPSPFDEEVPALPEVAAPSEGLANPSAAINFDAIAAAATTRPDSIAAILERSPEHFAVQLTAMETQALADGFVANHELENLEDLVTLELAREAEFYYVVLLGVFDTFAEAKAAVDSRPESLAEIQPSIRPLASIQNDIMEAESLHMGLSN
jgi:hypothetical protein